MNSRGNTSSALEIDQVVKSFRGRSGVVLDRLTCVWSRASSSCWSGRRGSGKSTTIHLVAALDHPSSGTIRVHGRDLGTIAISTGTAARRSA